MAELSESHQYEIKQCSTATIVNAKASDENKALRHRPTFQGIQLPSSSIVVL